jgi:methylphosphotriester-DNA--protein-cysteine methyltransferase
MVVVVSTDDDTKLFHVAGCPFIHDKNKVRTLTAKEAIDQGYTPCLRCMRKYLNVAGNQGEDQDDDHEAEAGLRREGH